MKEYIIKKGNHYSTHIIKPYLGFKKEFNIQFKFNENCRYNLEDVDQLDINKLWGISFGYHEANSIRIGWVYNLFTDKIDLYYYIYENSVRKYAKFSECFINDTCVVKLLLSNTSFTMIDKGNPWNIISETYNYPDFKLGYYLWPYFGGNEVAPHDIHIQMEID